MNKKSSPCNVANLRPLHDIAKDIRAFWPNPYFGARPYIQALLTLQKITDHYGQDSGESIVLYFLSNTSTWRGPNARLVKDELKQHLATLQK